MKRAFLGKDGSWPRLVLMALGLLVLAGYSLAKQQYMLLVPTLLGLLVLVRLYRHTTAGKRQGKP